MSRVLLSLGLVVATIFTSQAAMAETPAEILAMIKAEASAAAGYQEFSAARGEKFFHVKHGDEWSCSSCHTDNPMNEGKHAKTEKLIKPLAPAANAERFTELKKVEKWFKRNCNDVLNRECTAQEKGDVMTYLLGVGTKHVEAPKIEAPVQHAQVAAPVAAAAVAATAVAATSKKPVAKKKAVS
ncbi:MAG: DUF1924 domain-containing protein [Gallionella sp.]|nr:DUF1924 domain-containing protein [Gallionella sp.]